MLRLIRPRLASSASCVPGAKSESLLRTREVSHRRIASNDYTLLSTSGNGKVAARHLVGPLLGENLSPRIIRAAGLPALYD